MRLAGFCFLESVHGHDDVTTHESIIKASLRAVDQAGMVTVAVAALCGGADARLGCRACRGCWTHFFVSRLRRRLRLDDLNGMTMAKASRHRLPCPAWYGRVRCWCCEGGGGRKKKKESGRGSCKNTLTTRSLACLEKS